MEQERAKEGREAANLDKNDRLLELCNSYSNLLAVI